MNLLLTLSGLCLLLAGGEGLVRGAVATARRIGISPLIIGVTVVGFGTSAPELVISVNAALSGAPALALGNVLGSNIANILLILGTAALICPIAVHPDALRRDGTIMLGATVLFAAVALESDISRLEGAVMVVLLFAYLGWSVRSDLRRSGPVSELHREEAEQYHPRLPQRGWSIALVIAAGLAGLVVGARLAVEGATGLAHEAGVSDAVIGVTLVAFGTSLPELATALAAARSRQSDVCLGNIVGSNLFNLLGIGGASAIAAPLPTGDAMTRINIWIVTGATFLLIGFMLTGRRISRCEGLALAALYAGFIAFQIVPGIGFAAG